jgi:hypothetical protein
MRLATEPIDPVRKTRHVDLDPAAAFTLFTEGMATWWPLATHSIGGDDAVDVVVEGRVGGRIVERTADGAEHSWADVLAWDPPHRFVVAWHPNPAPEAASILEIRFVADGSGTRVELEHRGWEEFGDAEGATLRARYDDGWEPVLAAWESAVMVG